MPEHGNVIMKRQLLTQMITKQHPLIHPKLQYHLAYQPKNRGIYPETHKSVPQNFFPSADGLCDGTDTNRASNSIILFSPNPAVQNTIYVSIRSLIATTTTDIERPTQKKWCPNSSYYSLRNTYVCAPETPRYVLRKWYGVLCCEQSLLTWQLACQLQSNWLQKHAH